MIIRLIRFKTNFIRGNISGVYYKVSINFTVDVSLMKNDDFDNAVGISVE